MDDPSANAAAPDTGPTSPSHLQPARRLMSTEQPGRGRRVNNDDMHMASERLEHLRPSVRAAMDQAMMVELFDDLEADANRAKRWHARFGATSLVLLIVVLECGLFKMVAPRFEVEVPGWLDTARLVAGVLPFLLTAFAYFAEFHEEWLLNRFKTERIRHWKFQQLLDGAYIESLGEPSSAADRFSSKWQELLAELDGGRGHLLIYVNDRPFRSPFAPRPYTDEAVFADAVSIYHQYRLNLQLNWFTQEKERYQRVDKRTESAAGTLLFLGVLAAFAEGILHFTTLAEKPLVEPGLIALGIGLTLLSAGVRVYRSASGVSENAERYQRLTAQLGWHASDFTKLLDAKRSDGPTQEKLLDIVLDVERLCHGEMVEFIRMVEKSDYIV